MNLQALKDKLTSLNKAQLIEHIPDEFLTAKRLENLLLAVEEESKGKLTLESLPYHLVLEPTNICNLACQLCSTGIGPANRKKGTMKLEEFKSFIDQNAETTLELYLQNWGEPTLSKFLPEMVQYAASKGIWTHVSTNFSRRYPEGYLKSLVCSGLAVLHIDIDGLTQEVYESYRVKGNLAQVLENAREAIQIKKNNGLKFPIIEGTMIVNRFNEQQAPEFLKFGAELGLDQSSLSKLQINPNSAKDWLPADPKYRYQSYDTPSTPPKPCHWPWSGLVLNWTGAISPCCIVDDANADFGNVFEQDLRTIWNNDHFVSARAEFSDQKQIKINTICNICKNDTHNPNLPRFKDTFSIALPGSYPENSETKKGSKS